MKQKFFFGMLSSLLLASCSQDEMVQMNQDEIRFSVSAESPSRAADSYCANWLPGSFKLWAQTSEDGTMYIPGDEISAIGNQIYGYQGNNVRFWPASGKLDFLAYTGDDQTFNGDLVNPQFVNFKVKDNPKDQLDLVYAVHGNASKSAGPVSLNFRHALSQVVFQVFVNNPTIKVAVRDVKIGHIYNEGTYSLPSQATDGSWTDASHSDVPRTLDEAPSTGLGTWTYTGSLADYTVSAARVGHTDLENSIETERMVTYGMAANISQSYQPSSEPGSSATNNHLNDNEVLGNGSEGWQKVLNLLPQKQNAWTTSSSNFDGAYIALNCRIYNTTGEKDMTIYGEEGSAKWLYIPVEIDWRQGVRYVYTIEFGNNGGGIAISDDATTPTLSPVAVSVSSDEFGRLSGEVKEYNISFKEDGVKTSGLETITFHTTKNSVDFTVPNVTPTFPYADIYAGCSKDFDQLQYHPTFVCWTSDKINPYGQKEYQMSGYGRYTYANTTSTGLKINNYTLKASSEAGANLTLIPAWGYNCSFDFDFHTDETFGFHDPNDGHHGSISAATIIGDARINGTVKRYPDTKSLVLPTTHEVVGWSKTYDPVTKNVGITPEYAINKKVHPSQIEVPFTDFTINDSGLAVVKLYAVYVEK